MRRTVSLLDHLPLPSLRNAAVLHGVRETQLFSAAAPRAGLAQLRRDGAARAASGDLFTAPKLVEAMKLHVMGPAEYSSGDLRDVFFEKSSRPKLGRLPKSGGAAMTGAERARLFRARQRGKA